MKSLVERCGDIWDSIRQSSAQMPTRVVITRDHVDEEVRSKLGTDLQPHEDYFQVRVNEMFLTYDRKWFAAYAPMVFTIAEFTYNQEMQTVPFVVGPTMMKQLFGNDIPPHMIFSNTRVAGLHPYRGGRLVLTIVLYRVQRKNYGDQFLQIIESAAGVLDFSTTLSTYVKIAGVVLDGIEALLGLGKTNPLVGLRIELDRDAGDKMEPSYFGLINMPEGELDTNKLWVNKEQQLVYGNSMTSATPFRNADYVLYSLIQTPVRSDETTLPFYPSYKRVIDAAMESNTSDKWDVTKAYMADLNKTLRFSPDLTTKQYEELRKRYIDEMVKAHEQSVAESDLGPAEEVDSEIREAISILEL